MKTVSQFDWMASRLNFLKGNGLYRQIRVLEDIGSVTAKMEGREYLLFCGNDYLGLRNHPNLVKRAQNVLESCGVGAGSARLISGTSKWHALLESRIAEFLGKERSLVFSSGYLANLGVFSALTQKNDLVILDKLCHASLIDAARLSDAEMRIYPHGRIEYLEKILKNTRDLNPLPASAEGGGKRGRIWIVTDSIFSMDGDLAPLEGLVALKNKFDAHLVLDEAHGTGVFGPSGRGVSEHLGVLDEVDIHIGTLSKALGSIGGFVAGSTSLVDYLINHARTFIFETALPPSACAAALEAFDLIAQQPDLRRRLWNNVEHLRKGLKRSGAPLLEASSPIIPIVFGDERRTLRASQFLFDHGILIPAIRYPTVPKGKARLRATVSSSHTPDQLDRLIGLFKPLLDAVDE